MRRFILLVLIASATSPSRIARADDGYTDDDYRPDLTYVSPGVQVIANYGEPIFYADNYFWWWSNNAWYRSSYDDRGWVHIVRPPLVIAAIDRPYAYRYYQPYGHYDRPYGTGYHARPYGYASRPYYTGTFWRPYRVDSHYGHAHGYYNRGYSSGYYNRGHYNRPPSGYYNRGHGHSSHCHHGHVGHGHRR